MATIQKRGISLLLVLVLMLGMIPSVSAAEIETQPSTEPAETTTPATEETLVAETSPPETTQPEETSPPETTEPETAETVLEEESEPVEESSTEETQAETAPEEELSLSLMSLDDGVATIADTEIVGAPNAFGNVFLLNGGIDIPAFDHVQHKEHLPLYSVYLKNQPGYENNYYVAYCIEPGVVLGESGGHTGSSTTVGGMTDGSGALEWLSREAFKSQHFDSESRNKQVHRYHRMGINRFCGTDFTEMDMRLIYTYLGNRCNHEKTLRFIRSGYDMEVLK